LFIYFTYVLAKINKQGYGLARNGHGNTVIAKESKNW